MKLAIDASSAVTGGGLTYLRELLPRLAGSREVELGCVLIRAEVQAVGKFVRHDLPVVSVEGRAAARSGRWARAVAASKPDLVYAPTEISFRSYSQPLVLALRNPCLDPANTFEYRGRRNARWSLQRALARRSRRRAAGYVAVSRYAADIGRLALGIGAPIGVVYHGGPPARPVRAGPVRSLLFVSDLYRYKNVHRLLRALAEVDAEWSLQVVGAPIERDYGAELVRLAESLSLTPRVSFRGSLSGHELREAYASADALVWPSYAETFGHPLVEARSHGLPIVAARAASNEEVAGAAARYADPFDVRDLAAVLTDAVTQGIDVGELPRPYSWETCAAETVAFFRDVVQAA